MTSFEKRTASVWKSSVGKANSWSEYCRKQSLKSSRIFNYRVKILSSIRKSKKFVIDSSVCSINAMKRFVNIYTKFQTFILYKNYYRKLFLLHESRNFNGNWWNLPADHFYPLNQICTPDFHLSVNWM